ncbi:RHS repeat-associated protein [Flavobacterium arsenatis]|uniref:RHS repeat-associated protein n=1 Tax=Flavobacterium arsenatis TaxID=1484332 RepID=A0ABU1TTV4_9FLAO|nr:RHS repeat-associated core domain-containing protein [Flavobacterium arsenatis]MDR6969257.1 RHS repeat-associated protein [Flavobacterium arsenatis]
MPVARAHKVEQAKQPIKEKPCNLQGFFMPALQSPDHLGTSTFLTDANGVAYQFFLNLPFGETMAEQYPDSYYKTPFKFSGKEMDEETGLHYFGARYYDSRSSIWLSVDPLAESFPNWNPYNYTMQNPINLVDPTGMSPEGTEGNPPKGKVRIVLNLGGGGDIDDAAQTRVDQIKRLHPEDKLIFITDANLGNLKNNVESNIELAQKEGYGKTVEFSVFSHSGADGPKGDYDPNNSKDLFQETGSAYDKGQMSPKHWGDINFNFDKKNSVATFYGCDSAIWAEQFMSYSTMSHTAGIPGRAGGLYNTEGGANRSWFGLGKVFLRSVDENDNVLPLYLFTRGKYINTPAGRFLEQKEVYGHPVAK